MSELSPVTAILVAYNSASVIGKAIAPLLADPLVAQVIVVDNCSVDNTCDLIHKEFPTVKVIENPRNEGFGRANNVAIGRVRTPYALLVNPDAVMQEGAIAALIEASHRYPEAGILAPTLLDESGHVHRSYKRSVFDREGTRDNYIEPEGDLCADFLSGAVWLFNTKHMMKVGCFDPKLFLYYEDDDLCLRVREAGHGLVLVHAARAVHLQGKSSGEISQKIDYFKQMHLTWSRLYIEEKYRGRKAAQRLALKLRALYSIKAALYLTLGNLEKVNRHRGRLEGVFNFSEGTMPTTAA